MTHEDTQATVSLSSILWLGFTLLTTLLTGMSLRSFLYELAPLVDREVLMDRLRRAFAEGSLQEISDLSTVYVRQTWRVVHLLLLVVILAAGSSFMAVEVIACMTSELAARSSSTDDAPKTGQPPGSPEGNESDADHAKAENKQP